MESLLCLVAALVMVASSDEDDIRIAQERSGKGKCTANRCDASEKWVSSAAPQHPELLKRYAVRPGWSVAGVDYAVGAASTSLKDPAMISMAGVSIDTSSRTVAISGNNLMLDG